MLQFWILCCNMVLALGGIKYACRQWDMGICTCRPFQNKTSKRGSFLKSIGCKQSSITTTLTPYFFEIFKKWNTKKNYRIFHESVNSFFRNMLKKSLVILLTKKVRFYLLFNFHFLEERELCQHKWDLYTNRIHTDYGFWTTSYRSVKCSKCEQLKCRQRCSKHIFSSAEKWKLVFATSYNHQGRQLDFQNVQICYKCETVFMRPDCWTRFKIFCNDIVNWFAICTKIKKIK